MKKINILHTLYGIIVILVILIILGFFYHNKSIANLEQYYEDQKIEHKKQNTITRNFFPDTHDLGSYKEVEYKLIESSHKIIDGIRNMHQSPILITSKARDLELCAGFLWLLSEELWGKNLPYYIGMLNQETRMPASAWELPDAYKYFGGKILHDFSGTFDVNKKDFWQKISDSEIKTFFVEAFSQKALFGDIGFLYDSTKYTSELIKTGNYNSHITKNMGISQWEKTIKTEQNTSHKQVIQEIFNCREESLEKLLPTMQHYKFTVGEKEVVLDGEIFYYIDDQNLKQSKVDFQYLDTISYYDVTLAHFFNGTSHVDSLLEMTCKSEFFPINIISINPRLIEKK